MRPAVRFAPSPTGFIHIGNARVALFNWLFIKRQGGTFILRFDDTDAVRSKQEYADATVEDLAWLGIKPDMILRQSDRFALYDAVVADLKASGRLYACYETPDELDRKRRRQAASGRAPIYDRAALKLSPADRAQFEADGRKPHWRFLLEHKDVTWTDLIRGEQSIDAASLSDPVLVREDGAYLYTLTSVVDDISLGISHVVRGEDHVSNAGVQIQIFEALGSKPPLFAHHNLLIAASGEGLSKRTGALSLKGLREDGLEPMAVACLATLIGTSDSVEPYRSLDALEEVFSFDKISRSPARFDPAELETLNARLLHGMPYEAARKRLEALGVGGGAAFWEVARANCVRLSDAATWWSVATEPLKEGAGEVDRAFLSAAAAHLPPEPWDGKTWTIWTDALKAATGRKGANLFRPLRLALTGRDRGPELAAFLPFIGRERALARLS